MALDQKQIAELYFKATGYPIPVQAVCIVTAFALTLEDHVLANQKPEIFATYETTGRGFVGQTAAPIKRVTRNDDDSFTVVIDGWPVDAPGIRK